MAAHMFCLHLIFCFVVKVVCPKDPLLCGKEGKFVDEVAEMLSDGRYKVTIEGAPYELSGSQLERECQHGLPCGCIYLRYCH
jgi:hypothetical protein